MISLRCQAVVAEELKTIGIHDAVVHLGEVHTNQDVSPCQYHQMRKALESSGFRLLEDKKSILVQKIKNAIIDLVLNSEEPPVHTLSVYLSDRLDYDYTYLSNLFSGHQDMTIENFHIHYKIDRVKELLLYEGLSLTEIAFKLHYCNVAHLSNQFKKITGLSPRDFIQRKGQISPFLEDS